MEGFIEYTSRIYKRLVADGVMRDGMENVPFNDIVLHATADERARLGELLVEESGRQGENKEAVRKEWDALVEGILKYGAKEPLKDVQPHADGHAVPPHAPCRLHAIRRPAKVEAPVHPQAEAEAAGSEARQPKEEKVMLLCFCGSQSERAGFFFYSFECLTGVIG